MAGKKTAKRNAIFTIGLTIGILILVNVLAQWVPLRFDLTDSKRYSLSKVSIDAARALDGVDVRVFVSTDLPTSIVTPYGQKQDIRGVAREFFDRLFEYESRSEGKLTVTKVVSGRDMSLEDKAAEAKLELFTGKEAEFEAGRLEFRRYALGATFQYKDHVEVLPLALNPEILEFEITKRLSRLKEKAEFSGDMGEELEIASNMSKAVRACNQKLIAYQKEQENKGDLTALVGGSFKATMRENGDEFKRSCDGVAAQLVLAKPLARENEFVEQMVESAGVYVEAVDHMSHLIDAPDSEEQTFLMLAERMVQIGKMVDDDATAIKDSPGRKTIGFLCGHLEFCPFADPKPLIQPELLQILGQTNPIITQFTQVAGQIEHQINQINEQLRRSVFERREIKLKRVEAGQPVPNDIAALVIFGARRPMSDQDLYFIDQFLLSGRSVLVFLDTWDIAVFNLRTASQGGDSFVSDKTHRQAWPTNLSNFLAHHGIKPKGTLVVEPQQHGSITVLQAQRQGQFTVQSHKAYPYPLLPTFQDLDKSHVLVRNIPALTLPYATTLEINGQANPELEFTTLISTSDQASATTDDVPVLPPLLLERLSLLTPTGSEPVAVLARGTFKSFFEGAPETDQESLLPFKDQGAGRLLVVGSNLGLENLSTGSVFDEFLPAQLTSGRPDFMLKLRDYIANFQNWQLRLAQIGPIVQANVDFLHNALDWGVQNDTLVDIRSKAWTQRPIRTVPFGVRVAITAGMIIGLPLIFIAVGLLRFASRRRIR